MENRSGGGERTEERKGEEMKGGIDEGKGSDLAPSGVKS